MDKLELELNVVRHFQAISGGVLANYQLGPGMDPPDILAECAGHLVGVEVRRLFADESNRDRKGSSQRRQLGLRTQIANKASEIHRTKTDKSFHINIHFNCHREIFRRDVTRIAVALVDFLVKQPILMNEVFAFRAEDFWGPDWPEEVDYLSGFCLESEDSLVWGLTGSGWVGETSRELIQNSLNIKEKGVWVSKNSVNEAWVLLVCDGSVESSMLKIHSGIDLERYHSSFDRAFVMGYHLGDKVKELNIGAKWAQNF